MTGTDTAFTARFAPQTIAGMVANQASLANFVPSASPINTGMLSDIGRANIYAPDLQDNFYGRFMRAPLPRGDSVMAARIGEVVSRAYDPAAPDTALFNAANPSMQSIVAKKNFSRQIAVEINDYILKQFVQTEEMIGDVAAAIMATSNACYRDDMWVASKAYFSGSCQAAQNDQLYVMTTAPTDPGYADEMVETLWGFAENKFAYKSTKYNQAQFNTKSENIHIALKKDVEFPAFKKLYSETFNPEFIKIAPTIDYVDDFATPAGAPATAGDLIGMVVDTRAFDITPMPDTLTTEAFRNPARKSTAYFTTYEYAFQKNPFFNIAYIFAKQ